MIIIWIGVGVIVANIILTALALWVGARLMKTERGSLGRAAVTALIVGVLPPMVQISGVLFHLDDLSIMSLFFGVALLSVVISWAVIAWMYGLTTQRAVALWLATFVPLLGLTAVLLYVVEPHVAEAYVVPSHSMAPTLLGPHRIGECPDGSGEASVLVKDVASGEVYDKSMLGVCHDSGRAETIRILGDEVHPADRFLVNKLATPRRWDVIVFHDTESPEYMIVKRLVGMPGETVELKDGRLWINGEVVKPPPGLARLRFELDPVRHLGGPVALSEDEMFVLGDFVEMSDDSRVSGPISRSNVIGVAELIYWPMDRWRLLR